MAQADRRILVFGLSHVIAISSALQPKDASTEVIRIPEIRVLGDPVATAAALHLQSSCPTHVFISLGGNYHNSFGLIENPVPFGIGDAKRGRIPVDDARRFIPLEMMTEHFEAELEVFLQWLAPIRALFGAIPLHHLCAPPPVGDEDYIRRHPSIFSRRLPLGLAPRELRLALYRIQCEIYRRRSEEAGIGFVLPPAAAIDPEGFLARPYRTRDPTHGNRDYGALVLDQIAAVTGQVR